MSHDPLVCPEHYVCTECAHTEGTDCDVFAGCYRVVSYSRPPSHTCLPLTPTDILPTSSDLPLVAARLLANAGLSAAAALGGASSVDATVVHDGRETVSEALSRAEQIWDVLSTALSAWCGPFAYHALLTRALLLAQITHPPLAALRVGRPSAPQLEGLGVMEATAGDAAIAEASQALLTALIDLLSRVIGEAMAVDTVSQALAMLRAVPAMGSNQ